MGPEDQDDKGGNSFWTVLRRVLAALLLVGSATWLILSDYFARFETCSDHVARTGAHASVRLCGAVEITHLLPVILFAFVLLLPDLDEISIAGIGSLKRRVELQDQRQELLTERVDHLQATAQANSSARADPTINLFLDLAARGALQDLGDGRVEDDHAALDEPSSEGQPADELAPEFAEFELKLAVIDAWEKLVPYLAGVRDTPPADADRDLIVRWNERYREEIALVREVRNNIAHGSRDPLARDTLARVVAVAERLVASLDQVKTGLDPGASPQQIEDRMLGVLRRHAAEQSWSPIDVPRQFDVAYLIDGRPTYFDLLAAPEPRADRLTFRLGKIVRDRSSRRTPTGAAYALVVMAGDRLLDRRLSSALPDEVRSDLDLGVYVIDLSTDSVEPWPPAA
jgi:hypothetical protein